MKLLSSPEFSRKLVDLSTDSDVVARVARVVASIERAQNRLDLTNMLELNAGPVTNDVYVARAGDARVFISFGTGPEGEYALLLDVALSRAQPTGSVTPLGYRNPRVNSMLNPSINTALNPRINSSLNPRINSHLNPRINAALNPRINSALNPRINASLNPRINSSLNPRINAALNPRINATINPRTNPAFAGPYLYSLKLDQEGYLVRANDTVDIAFDIAGNMTGIAVRNASGGSTLFDQNSEWIGYLVRANNDVQLRFSVDGDWIGLAA